MEQQEEGQGLLNQPYKKYGSTTFNCRKPEFVVCHQVQKEDTIQGIALKYDITMEQVKHHNKIWSAESIHLYDYLEVPVSKEVYEHFSDGAKHPDISLQKKNSLKKLSSASSSASVDLSEQSPEDVLSKIDSNIALMKLNMQKFESFSKPEREMSRMEIQDPVKTKRENNISAHPACWDAKRYQNASDMTSTSGYTNPVLNMSMKQLLTNQDRIYQL